ncbi:MAG TPA: VWA domain-containing protein [Mycobacteriales bacterium]|nr:VWA domain-containing protein [Mycobacteriales bacterium]
MTEPLESPRRLGLLASAVAGRWVEVAPAEQGEPSWTDGLTIFVDSALEAREALQAAAVQAVLLAAGSLETDIVEQLQRGRDVCGRYLAIEGQRALTAHTELLPAATMALVSRAESRSNSPAESLDLARGSLPIEAPPIVFGQIRPRLIRLPASAIVGGQTEATEVRATKQVHEIEDAAELDEPDRTTGDDLSSPVGGGGAIGRVLQRLTTGVRSRDAGSPGADSASHLARRGRATGRRIGRVSVAPQLGTDAEQIGRPLAQTYPEWDCNRGAYRQDWCTVREREPVVGREPLAIPNQSRALRRALGRVMPDLARVHRRAQGDDLDVDAIVGEQVDLRAGLTPDEAVYIDNVRSRRDLAVLVLLDASASAAEPSNTGASVHHHQRAVTASLTTSLHQLGDRVAVSAFRSMGRDNVEVIPIKRFTEPAGAAMLSRLAGLTPGAYTRLGAAIRHGSATLDRDAGTTRRLLIVVSDGFAYDHGYEGRYGETDARRALSEARRAGVGCLCLSIGGNSPADDLTRVFGSAAHATIANLDELPAVVTQLFPAALRSADHRRRLWQHRSRSTQRQLLDRRTA